MAARKPAPPPPLSFVASIPPLQSAFTFDGIDGAARVKLDIPASDYAAADRLKREFIGRAFRVTIEALPSTPGAVRERRVFG